MVHLNCRLLLAVLVLILHVFAYFSVAGHAEDKEHPFYIASDRAQLDGQRGITVYEGNVELIQGTLTIFADKITIYNHRKNISEIIASGQPARYQQKAGIEQGDIIAKANMIRYLLTKRNILLQGDASITQDGATFTGEVINYDIDSTVMRASSDRRVQMVIPPNNDK